MVLPHIEFFSKLIERELGIIYSESNYFQLQNRLDEIVRILSISSVEELYRQARIKLSQEVKQLVLDVATNNETSFFRDPKLFTTVRNRVFPSLLEKAKSMRKVRIWSAASSFGQEPYSLAISILDLCNQIGQPSLIGQFEILASDIASRVLERAQTGRYTQLEVQRGLSAPLLVKHFTKDGDDHWTLKAEVRKLVSFRKLNLLDSFKELGAFDLIFCRNVLIYQNVENKKKIISKLASCLSSGGHLVMGAGESLIGLSSDFESVLNEEAVLYQVKPTLNLEAA